MPEGLVLTLSGPRKPLLNLGSPSFSLGQEGQRRFQPEDFHGCSILTGPCLDAVLHIGFDLYMC